MSEYAKIIFLLKMLHSVPFKKIVVLFGCLDYRIFEINWKIKKRK